MDSAEKRLLDQCIQHIEERYYPELLASGKNLKQRDLEYLIDVIEERTGIKISLSTMKRIWKKTFTNLPHPSTLNALVSLLDYKSWGDFKQSLSSQQPLSQKKSRNKSSQSLWIAAFAVIIIAVLTTIGFSTFRGESSPGIPESILFTANKTVDMNVPNSVIFQYDLSEVVADSFFIQRSWNPMNKSEIDPDNEYFTEIYYYPGFHWARLIANETVVERQRIHIQTDGWFALARSNGMQMVPTYLDQTDLIEDGKMRVTRENLVKSNFDLNENLQLSYYNIQDFEGIDSKEFVFEARVKFESVDGLTCPQFEVQFIDEIDISWYRIIQQGCESNLFLKIGEQRMPGSENDFSKLGVNLEEWQYLRIEASNGKLDVYLNDQPALQSDYQGTVGDIMGVVLNFTGMGIVDFVKLSSITEEPTFSYEF